MARFIAHRSGAPHHEELRSWRQKDVRPEPRKESRPTKSFVHGDEKSHVRSHEVVCGDEEFLMATNPNSGGEIM